MKRNLQSVFLEVRRSPSFIFSKMNTGKAIGVLLLAVIAIAFTLSNPQRTSSAVVKNTENGVLPHGVASQSPSPSPSPAPACEAVPIESCSTESATGDRTCRFQTTSCEAFDNPCTGELVPALVTTTLVIHRHTDARGGDHFRSHLEMHGKTPTAGQCTNTITSASPGGSRFAFIKASTSQTGDIFSLVKNSGFNASGPPPETFSDPLTVHIITTDGTPNFTLHLTLHATINANGELSSCISHERTSCPQPTSN